MDLLAETAWGGFKSLRRPHINWLYFQLREMANYRIYSISIDRRPSSNKWYACRRRDSSPRPFDYESNAPARLSYSGTKSSGSVQPIKPLFEHNIKYSNLVGKFTLKYTRGMLDHIVENPRNIWLFDARIQRSKTSGPTTLLKALHCFHLSPRDFWISLVKCFH